MNLQEILRQKQLQQQQQTSNSNISVEALKTVVKDLQGKRSLAEILAEKKDIQEKAKEAFLVSSPVIPQVTEVTEVSGTIATAYPDSKLQGNVLLNVKESLLQRMQREKALKEASNPALKQEAVLKTDSLVNPNSGVALSNTPYDPKTETGIVTIPSQSTDTSTFNLSILLNEKQQAAVDFIPKNQSFVLLGAAGTGKTTSERGMCHKILSSPTLTTTSFKLQGDSRIDAPSVAICAFTRRASNNSAKAIHKDPELASSLMYNIMTIHALLEFVPLEYYDPELEKEVFRFEPTRDASNPLQLTHLIVEEATLVGLDLWELVLDALPASCQIIFVGDINQLPPVFGPSILNYAITMLPVIELTQVYRQKEGSPIINNAHRILQGLPLEEGRNEEGALQIVEGKHPTEVGQEKMAQSLALAFKTFYNVGKYDPNEDIILCPYNKQDLGTSNMNYHIASILDDKFQRVVYEVIVGFNKRYFAITDKIMYNKRDAVIIKIEPNNNYLGKQPKLHSLALSRFGEYLLHKHHNPDELEALTEDDEGIVIDYSSFNVDDMLDNTEKKMQASHKVTIAYEDGREEVLSAVGDLQDNVFTLGYCLSIHKSQGSEWRRVFIIFHKDQTRNLSREMLYTAITRAREEVYLISKKYLLDKVVKMQRVKGNTLKDKIAYFNDGLEIKDNSQLMKGRN
jgi:hypothetical protein